MGLSFKSKGKLNMKMGLNLFSAHDVINKLDKNDLAKIFKNFGDEKDARKISQTISVKRKKSLIKTEDLTEIINSKKIIIIN